MMKTKFGGEFDERFRTFANNDLALEWCEENLLENTRFAHAPTYKAAIADYELLKDFSCEEVEIIRPLLQTRNFERGQNIINAGDDAREMYFIARGSVSVYLPGEARPPARDVSGGDVLRRDGLPRRRSALCQHHRRHGRRVPHAHA